MQLQHLAPPERIFTGLSATDYQAAQQILAQKLAAEDNLPEAEIIAALQARENKSSTVVAPGVGFPHIRESFLPDFYIAIGLFPAGLAAPGQETPVRVVVLYLVPEGKSNLYLLVMSAMARFLAKPGTLENLQQAASPAAVEEIIAAAQIELSEIVTAADIIAAEQPVLREDATLREAADLMDEKKLEQIGVVDAAGDYLGVVSAGGLLRVGMPDYLLMMDNLSFLKTFEPFAALLKQEQSMRVSEILKTDAPVFQAQTPMIQVAAKLVEKHDERGVVLRGKKYLGGISRLDFVHKVVRV